MSKVTGFYIAIVIIGLIVGFNFISKFTYPSPSDGMYFSNTKIITSKPFKIMYLNNYSYELELKGSNEFEFSLYYSKYSYNTSGFYLIDGKYLSFDQRKYENIINENYSLRYEDHVILREKSGVSNNRTVFYKLHDGSIILFSTKSALYFKRH